ncbi:hypothetical protein GWK47_033623 [Chionoecetes opilio]|uniref:Uncharacterized protein n=1 Tax=Chionoecetes opilio TaxID=41210 RepID=A0A8J4YPJ9_CHIOP|nr:hypothetical protein GWK47_033623 [Chionoecetes opilio]
MAPGCLCPRPGHLLLPQPPSPCFTTPLHHTHHGTHPAKHPTQYTPCNTPTPRPAPQPPPRQPPPPPRRLAGHYCLITAVVVAVNVPLAARRVLCTSLLPLNTAAMRPYLVLLV